MSIFNKDYIKQIMEGFRVQTNVIRALYYRELLTRITKIKFGLLGIFIEPIGGVVVWLLIFGFRRGFRPVLSLDLVIFLGVGNIIINLFNSIAKRSTAAMTSNQALFFYRSVKPVDTIVARALVEINSYGIVYIVIVCAYYFFQNKWLLDNLPLIFLCYLSIALLGIGLGLIIMVAAHRYILVTQIVNVIFRPLYFISGVIFPLSALPQWIKPWLVWNPILHAIELSRKGFSDNYFLDPLISLSYLLKVTLVVFTIGLFIYVNNEKILLTR